LDSHRSSSEGLAEGELWELVSETEMPYEVLDYLHYKSFIPHIVNNYFNVFPLSYNQNLSVGTMRDFIYTQCQARRVPEWMIKAIVDSNSALLTQIQVWVDEYCSTERSQNPFDEPLFIEALTYARNLDHRNTTHMVQ
jgi:hypothetical protein